MSRNQENIAKLDNVYIHLYSSVGSGMLISCPRPFMGQIMYSKYQVVILSLSCILLFFDDALSV